MKSETRRNANAALNRETRLMTMGEIFANDTVIELVADSSSGKPNLLLWNGRTVTVASQVEYEGRTYEAPVIQPSVLGAMRLPGRCAPYTSGKKLLASIAHLFTEHLDLPAQDSNLLAHFSLSTWFVDFLPSAPRLVVSGADVHRTMNLLRLLSCVCRRALMLADLTPSGFRALPLQLRPTLLINEPRLTPRMATLLRTSSHRGLCVSGRRGEIIDLYGARAVFGELNDAETMISEAINLVLSPATVRQPVLGEDRLNQIAMELQPRLLTYRLTNWRKVRESDFDIPTFTFPTRALVGNLGACVVDDQESLRQLPLLLQSQDEEVRLRRSADIRCAIIQIILLHLHKGESKEMRIDELSALTNALLRSKGETLVYSPREVGWKLRELGLHRQRDGAGKFLMLGMETSRHVHELGRSYGLLSAPILGENCADCASQPGVAS